MPPVDCPYDAFDPATIAFCEARLCAWVAEPANAYSSLTKTLVGLAILVDARRRRTRDARAWIGVAALAQGPMGFALHATGTFVGEFLDVSGMFVLGGLLFTFALGRLRRWSGRNAIAFFATMQLSFMALLALVRPIGIALFVVQLLGFAVAELCLAIDGRRRADTQGALAMVGAMAVGFGCWLLDKGGVWCSPDNHLVNGHAVWHVLTSVAVWFFWVDQRSQGPVSERVSDMATLAGETASSQTR
jgi:hypothetical protein